MHSVFGFSGPSAPLLSPPVGDGKQLDSRASLMDAIRNAGGTGKAKLKSAANRKTESKKKKQEESSKLESGGNLMSDLADKLRLRRKGMAGGGSKGDSKGSKNIFDRMADIIPPPPPGSSASHSADTKDKDWE